MHYVKSLVKWPLCCKFDINMSNLMSLTSVWRNPNKNCNVYMLEYIKEDFITDDIPQISLEVHLYPDSY